MKNKTKQVTSSTTGIVSQTPVILNKIFNISVKGKITIMPLNIEINLANFTCFVHSNFICPKIFKPENKIDVKYSIKASVANSCKAFDLSGLNINIIFFLNKTKNAYIVIDKTINNILVYFDIFLTVSYFFTA